ncbi:MAG: 3-deoxy-8-phosphooctulonate synthase [Candidatus Omnitrophota bacterium]|nr:MAG: 3-deoxy-8-phosphooctulonate synthase [Candidatus Omnitrophota bacterium]
MGREINIGNIKIGGNNGFFLIAGPCVIENEEITFEIAKELKKITSEEKIPFIFKASFDKANRTSIHSFRGPGLKEGLRILKEIKESLNIPVTTDVHCVYQIDKVSEVVDIIQIPAFLSRQTDLLISAGKTGKPVNVKKGQFLAPWDVKNVIEKIESTGNRNILLTERGTCFGYNRLVVDFCSLPIMRSFGYPVIFDATHSVQQPGAKGDSSGGNREFVPYLAKAAVAAGVDGIFMEVHPEPEKALSDGPNMLELERLKPLLKTLKRIEEAVKDGERKDT